MVNGLLEVVLVDAAGGIDPYVIIKCKIHERESCVSIEGSKPMRNEKFNFRVPFLEDSGGSDPYKLFFKVMEKDIFSADDMVGQIVIYLEDLLALGVEKGRAEIHPRLQVSENESEEEFGGWKEALNYRWSYCPFDSYGFSYH
ncbi:hypothetical protein MKW92_046876 [Papaver armeniacum]|nr:hypothetical protein MKW92_046876 [Papaver armeniacum]